MRYAVLGGGKRVRPLLVQAAGLAFEAPPERLADAAVAVELIHAYSLVHDDMPEMDNDSLRRGKPTVHIAYDTATALLVGDALQTLAFEVMAAPGDAQAARMVRELARASGSRGMAGGQAIDLESVGVKLGRDALEQMHRMKTGALLRCAVWLGALAARIPTPAEAASLDTYSAATGLAFQVVDDILDARADTATLGKTAGKDAAAGKPTFVSMLGMEASEALAGQLRQAAQVALARLPGDTARLAQIADFIVQRAS
jgi:farnesyl diphosphate synthase